MKDLRTQCVDDKVESNFKAWDSLARWKFWMFGYHAGDWVKLNRRLGDGRYSPFKVLVEIGRAVRDELEAGHGVPYITFTVHRRPCVVGSAHPASAGDGA